MATQWDRLLPHIESAALATVIGGTYPLDKAALALRDLDERRVTGKIILQTR
ncbi:zinc-binding dehydrogenase [Nocardia nepalensis]|uniref:zinc-binding dehydrogenase n=1 Tax=Nocardia nepalensis TaxID=3375448 RepID=UPI003B67E5D1